mmetsp:Transcript_37993/g.100501  ORF Transcript_37993/g.100501 Transcript_37993/m.100501 type:complete len:259 (-) Transcript_37993:235-1011(-)
MPFARRAGRDVTSPAFLLGLLLLGLLSPSPTPLAPLALTAARRAWCGPQRLLPRVELRRREHGGHQRAPRRRRWLSKRHAVPGRRRHKPWGGGCADGGQRLGRARVHGARGLCLGLSGQDEIVEVQGSHGIRKPRVWDGCGRLVPSFGAQGTTRTSSLGEALRACGAPATPGNAGAVEDVPAQRAEVLRRARAPLDGSLRLPFLGGPALGHRGPDVCVHADDVHLLALLHRRPANEDSNIPLQHGTVPLVDLICRLID